MTPLPSPDSVLALIRSRRTIQLFRPDPVDRALILNAIDAGRWAPNHRLTQPWRFYLLGTETATAIVELNARLVEETRGPGAAAVKRARWGAIPGWLVVTSQRSKDSIRNQEDYASSCCAIQNLMLYLWSAGVATKWTTGDVTREKRFYEMVGIPEDTESVVGMIWYGFPAHDPTCDRLPVSDLVRVRP